MLLWYTVKGFNNEQHILQCISVNNDTNPGENNLFAFLSPAPLKNIKINTSWQIINLL